MVPAVGVGEADGVTAAATRVDDVDEDGADGDAAHEATAESTIPATAVSGLAMRPD